MASQTGLDLQGRSGGRSRRLPVLAFGVFLTVGATANFVFGAFACGQTPVWSSFDEFVKTSVPIKTTGVYGGSGYLLDVGLLKALGVQYQMITGYTSANIGLACTRGDGNFHVGS